MRAGSLQVSSNCTSACQSPVLLLQPKLAGQLQSATTKWGIDVHWCTGRCHMGCRRRRCFKRGYRGSPLGSLVPGSRSSSKKGCVMASTAVDRFWGEYCSSLDTCGWGAGGACWAQP